MRNEGERRFGIFKRRTQSIDAATQPLHPPVQPFEVDVLDIKKAPPSLRALVQHPEEYLGTHPEPSTPELEQLMGNLEGQMKQMQQNPKFAELDARRQDMSLSDDERVAAVRELIDLEGQYLEPMFPGQILYHEKPKGKIKTAFTQVVSRFPRIRNPRG